MAKRKTTTVTEASTETALSSEGPVDALSSEEERALRMRTGRSLSGEGALAGKAQPGTQAAARLAELEARIVQRYQAHLASEDAGEAESEDPAPEVDARMKSKIIRALRKKS